MKCISELTGKIYESEDCHFFKNQIQSAYYYSWGCELVDLSLGSDMKWIYVFKKSDHENVKNKWKEHCEKYKNEQNKN